jgi:hypothetical protein
LEQIDKIDSLICYLAYFYKGSASFEYLESQPLSKVFRLGKEAEKISKAMKVKER